MKQLACLVVGVILWGFFVSCSLPMPSQNTPTPALSPEPEVVLHNGTILTMEASQVQAQAILIKGDKIIAIGNEADV